MLTIADVLSSTRPFADTRLLSVAACFYHEHREHASGDKNCRRSKARRDRRRNFCLQMQTQRPEKRAPCFSREERKRKIEDIARRAKRSRCVERKVGCVYIFLSRYYSRDPSGSRWNIKRIRGKEMQFNK